MALLRRRHTARRRTVRRGPFADPGYQPDRKPRYQIGSEAKVRAAWAYINRPAYAAKYTAAQLGLIHGRIKRAGKRYGIVFGHARTRREEAARRDLRRRFNRGVPEPTQSRPGALFYVTARSGSRTAFLLGPYSSHMTAQSHVARGRQLAEERTREGAFGGIAYGTSSTPERVRTLFGR